MFIFFNKIRINLILIFFSHEAMSDVCWLMSQLLDVDGKIKIDGISDLVAPVTDEEIELYKKIEFDISDYQEDLKAHKLVTEDKVKILQNRWRFPSLSIHGIEGAFSGPGEKTVIPAKVIGKFSLRIVPNMEPQAVHKCVTDYLNKLWEQRQSPNKFKYNKLSFFKSV